MTSPPVIELEQLTVRLGNREILKGLTGQLKARTIGLLGPNGAGKSTLIQTLLGFIQPTSGTARILGHDIRSERSAVHGLVGYMPENDSFISHMSAVGFVRYMAELSGLPAEAALERAHEALFYVGLGEARYRKLGDYSLGMKQMAKLAQAIVHGPKLVILDEPTNGLDPAARVRMVKLIQEMRDSGSVNLVLCSHLLKDVEETCEEVLILKGGRLVHVSNLAEERRMNKRFLELETQGSRNGFLDAAREIGCECADLGNGRVKLVLGDGVEVKEIYRLAGERDLQLRRLSHRRDSLEDIFLRAMENND
jgi:ABC-2 type transport system ATP-binding protein